MNPLFQASLSRSFAHSVSVFGAEVLLNGEYEQYVIFQNYLSNTLSLISLPKPVMSIKERAANKAAAENKYKSVVESINRSVKEYKEQILNKNATLRQLSFDTSLTRNEYAEKLRTEIKNLDTTVSRLERVASDLSSASAKYVSYVDGMNTSYNLTYLCFLISKVIIFSLLMAIFLSIWASSSVLIYPMRAESYLSRWVTDEKKLNPYQPWAAWFCLFAIFFSSIVGSDMLSFSSVAQRIFSSIENTSSSPI